MLCALMLLQCLRCAERFLAVPAHKVAHLASPMLSAPRYSVTLHSLHCFISASVLAIAMMRTATTRNEISKPLYGNTPAIKEPRPNAEAMLRPQEVQPDATPLKRIANTLNRLVFLICLPAFLIL